MAEEARRLTVRVLECMSQGTTFDEGDPLDEELRNPTGLKEITSTIASLALLKPANFLASLNQLLAQVIAPEAPSDQPSEKRIETLCWLIHILRVFYSHMVPLLNPENASKIEIL